MKIGSSQGSSVVHHNRFALTFATTVAAFLREPYYCTKNNSIIQGKCFAMET